MGYPIASIDVKGEGVITMEKGKHGLVNTATVASQLLYEIQGPLYYNSDVTASIEDMKIAEIGENAVHVSGVKGLPPPSTTKGKSAEFIPLLNKTANCGHSRYHGQGWLASRVPLLPHRPRYQGESCHG